MHPSAAENFLQARSALFAAAASSSSSSELDSSPVKDEHANAVGGGGGGQSSPIHSTGNSEHIDIKGRGANFIR